MENTTTTIIVRFPVKPERAAEFQMAFSGLLNGLRQEPTFIEARVHQDLDDPNIVVFYETYREDRQSFLDRVPQKPWFKIFLDQLPDLLQRDRDVFWQERTEVY
ncbi:putative quinol monooxygenase [Sphaerothrix gracilis]|uniref:putative quinol monooxygenase n=1 Tax=Sphaerothrix gracilis TaxID=3151835 RepID=UPI0031FE11CA